MAIIILNVNDLKLPCKDRLAEFFKITRTICCLQENHFKYKGLDWLKDEKRYITYTINKASMAILISANPLFSSLLTSNPSILTYLLTEAVPSLLIKPFPEY